MQNSINASTNNSTLVSSDNNSNVTTVTSNNIDQNKESTMNENENSTLNNQPEVSSDKNMTDSANIQLSAIASTALYGEENFNTDLSEEKKSEKTDGTSKLSEKALTQWQDINTLPLTMANTTKDLFAIVNNSKRATLIDKIKLGAYLLKIKLVHKNKFYDVITEEIMHRVQVGRYMKVVLLNEDNYAKGMCIKSKDKKTIQSNLDLLVEDTRVTSLTLDGIQNFNDPTMARIKKLKELKTDDDFNKVIGGDEEPLKDLAEEKSKTTKKLRETAKTNAEKEKADEEKLEKERIESLKPNGMSETDYGLYLDKGIHTVISVLQDMINFNRQLLLANKNGQLELEQMKIKLSKYENRFLNEEDEIIDIDTKSIVYNSEKEVA